MTAAVNHQVHKQMSAFRGLRGYLHAPVRRDEAELLDRNVINLLLRGVRSGGTLTIKARYGFVCSLRRLLSYLLGHQKRMTTDISISADLAQQVGSASNNILHSLNS